MTSTTKLSGVERYELYRLVGDLHRAVGELFLPGVLRRSPGGDAVSYEGSTNLIDELGSAQAALDAFMIEHGLRWPGENDL